MAHGFSNRVWCSTSTTGTGNVTIGTAKPAHCTPDDAGTQDGDERTWLLEEGNDFEIFRGAYTASGALVTRGTVLLSKIAGTTGTTRMNMAGTATIREVAAGEDLISMVNSGAFGLSMLSTVAQSDAWALLDAAAGSNATGKWWKLPSGLMVSSQTFTSGTGSWSAGGTGTNFYYRNLGSVSFPASFGSTPLVVANAADSAVSDRSSYVVTYAPNSSGLSSLFLSSPRSTAPAMTAVNVNIVAIGEAS